MINSMGSFEFGHVAERISDAIFTAQQIGKGITVDDLEHITNGDGYGMNMYPSNHGGSCCHEAFFISLSSTRYAKSAGHLKFRKALEKLVQHTQGTCSGITKVAVLITDSWDANAIDEWRGNIEQIQQHIHLEVYLITNSRIQLLPI